MRFILLLKASPVSQWALQGLLAVLLLLAGVNWLPDLWPDAIEGLGDWFHSAVELLGVIGQVIPGEGRFAALWLTAVTAGAVVVHLTKLPPAAIGGLASLIAFARR
jgi:hypothetical protein